MTIRRFLLIAGCQLAIITAGCQTRQTDQAGKTALLWQPFASRGDSSENGRFSILLYILSDATNHAYEAQRYKRNTEKDAGWQGLFVVSKVDHSELYWGQYASPEDAAENLAKAKAYVAPAGIKLYAKALIVPLPESKVGPGPPEWDLNKVQGEYTVVVAVFYNVPEADYHRRKEDAVDYCRELRQRGEEAYYHHGIKQSKVTVGLFDKSVDPRVEEIIQRFQYLAVNGYEERRSVVNPETRNVSKVSTKPFLAHIPED